MKQKDIVIIVAVALVSAIFSYVVAGAVFGSKDKENLKAPIVQPISSQFSIPATDDPYINKNSINPTKTITIGEQPANIPF